MPPTTHTVIQNPHLAYRPDIDGLRALAIIAVVIFHAFPSWLPGGFVGVDIFFVISGYLITNIILKAQSGLGFSLLEFYSRRIKRIFPALIVVLVFCLVAGWYALLASEYKELGKHIAAGAGYVSNIALMNEAGYFDITAELKPLLHLWSLAIEEQFYLVWPLLLILTLRLNLNHLLLIVFLLIVSFLLNVIFIERYPIQVFFLPFSRSWELLIGSTLAYINLYKRHSLDRIASRILFRNPPRTVNALGNVFAWAGLIFIILALIGLNKALAFPGLWALLPTLGAVCLIAAGDQAWFNHRILASKLAVYIGLISYPLYLWHWPLLSFARIVEVGSPSILIRIGVIVLSGLLAYVTYWLVEKRLRYRQHWLVAVGLLASLAMIGAIGYQVYGHAGYANRYPQAERLARSVGGRAWDIQGWNQQTDCTEKFGKEFEQYCEINNIEKLPTVMLIGDSNANQFYPGLAKKYAETNDNLLNLGQGGCPPFYGVNVTMKEGNLHCEKIRDKALNFAIATVSVKKVVLSMLGVGYAIGRRDVLVKDKNFIRLSYPDDPLLIKPLEILERSMRVTLGRLSKAGKQVIFINSIPMLDFDPASCVDYRPWRITSAQLRVPCAIPQKEVDKLSGSYRNMVLRVIGDFPKVKLLESSHELCDGVNCWAMKAGVLFYRDSIHLNEVGSRFISEQFDLP